ncbi:hypothetical protein PflQ2_2447 [Pseudomonas fluorescens Q2-87]|uniref:Uncharacterized protein n=1 Tax=Pseudomonas fluorescens (strain Q2-87) TaxID=1038922 RepID=J2YEN6_PSEFQ|nr:hypothetical protein PflQ2_2447 [Pseudomonas fluorescens Q2-87]
MPGDALEETRETRFAHVQLASDDRQPHIAGEFSLQIFEGFMDALGTAGVKAGCVERARQDLRFVLGGPAQRIEQFQEQRQARQPLGRADGFKQVAGVLRGAAAERQSTASALEQPVQIAQFGQGPAQAQQRRAVELQHHVAPGQVLIGRQVAHPVVGQVRADHCDVAGAKRADIVTGQQLSAALADQMDFKFGMMVPARQRVRVIVLVPAKTVFGLGQDDFQFGRSLLEQGRSVIRHVAPLSRYDEHLTPRLRCFASLDTPPHRYFFNPRVPCGYALKKYQRAIIPAFAGLHGRCCNRPAVGDGRSALPPWLHPFDAT